MAVSAANNATKMMSFVLKFIHILLCNARVNSAGTNQPANLSKI